MLHRSFLCSSKLITRYTSIKSVSTSNRILFCFALSSKSFLNQQNRFYVNKAKENKKEKDQLVPIEEIDNENTEEQEFVPYEIIKPMKPLELAKELDVSIYEILDMLPDGFRLEKKIPRHKIEEILKSYGVDCYVKELKLIQFEPYQGEIKPTWSPKQPVVTLIGPPSSGKTSFLDRIRGTNEAKIEKQTRLIKSSEVRAPEFSQQVTFIDTPGHADYKILRRQAIEQLSDIVLLFICIEEGITSDVIECIKEVQEAKKPVVIVLSKADPKRGIDELKYRKELASYGLDKDVPLVLNSHLRQDSPASIFREIGKITKKLNLRQKKSNCRAEGIIINTTFERGLGICNYVLVKRGTFVPDMDIISGFTSGKVVHLRDVSFNKPMNMARPGQIVKIAGLNNIPKIGDYVFSCKSEQERILIGQLNIQKYNADKDNEEAVEYLNSLKEKSNIKQIVESHKLLNEGNDVEIVQFDEILPLVIRTDCTLTLKVVQDFLSKKGNFKIVKYGLGDVTHSDIEFAEEKGAIVIGVNVKQIAGVIQLVRETQIVFRKVKGMEEFKNCLDEEYERFLSGEQFIVFEEEEEHQLEEQNEEEYDEMDEMDEMYDLDEDYEDYK